MASSRDDFIIAIRSAFLKKSTKQKFSLLTLVFISIFIILLSSLDLKFIRYVQLTNSEGDQFYLEQRDTSFMAEYYSTPGTSAVDIPKYYANWDETFWVVAPTPDKTYEITLAYDKEPDTITTETGGTYLSNKYSDLLLYACLVNAYGYLKGPQDMLQYYQAAYNEALETYALEQIGNRRRDEYQDGEVRAQLNVKPPSSYGK